MTATQAEADDVTIIVSANNHRECYHTDPENCQSVG